MKQPRPSLASRPVDDEPAIHLGLELRLASSPVQGVVRFGDAPPMPFVGWMPLLSIIEAAHAGTLPARCDDLAPGSDEDTP